MGTGTLCTTVLLAAVTVLAHAQNSPAQQQIEEARRAAAAGSASAFAVRLRAGLGADWPPGIYSFYNAPRPFCFAYTIPGEWIPTQRNAVVRSNDGTATAGVTFVPPRTLERAEGSTMVERARNVAVREYEKSLRQTLTGVALLPFESARPGTWRLAADPVALPDGRRRPLPLHVIVDLSPHTVAEVNVSGTADDMGLARRIVDGIRTAADANCYMADTERLIKAMDAAVPEPPDPRDAAYAKAMRDARSDTTHPDYREWYRTRLFPEFNRLFETALRTCVAQVGHNGLIAMGLAFSLDREGAIKRIDWREDTALNTCVEPLLRKLRFASAPKDDFHVALESNP